MTLALAHPARRVVSLAPGQVWSLDPVGPETVLRCVAGRCWVTQADDRADYDLRAGATLELRRHGRVVVQALVPTTLRVRAARPASDPEQLAG
ncbi:MAG TPA: DUF2917 domain-containing protein [Chloroflexota bacterium]|nr:DUF2917 domain-containing protein [Chloroflexota bacterium]